MPYQPIKSIFCPTCRTEHQKIKLNPSGILQQTAIHTGVLGILGFPRTRYKQFTLDYWMWAGKRKAEKVEEGGRER